MKKSFSLLLIFFFSYLSAQELNCESSIEGVFNIDSVTLGSNGTANTVNVSGKAGSLTVYMTYTFTNKLETEGQGEYTAMSWAQDGKERLKATVQGLWKQDENNYEMKHFENTSNGEQLLTTGVMNFEEKTYDCIVRFLN